MSKEQVDWFYQVRAKEYIDMLFDKGYIREDVSRDGMKDIEDFLAFCIQQQCESAAKCAVLTKKIKDRENR